MYLKVGIGGGVEGGKSALLLSTEGSPRLNTDARILQFFNSRQPGSIFSGHFGRILDKNCIIFKNLQIEPEKVHPF